MNKASLSLEPMMDDTETSFKLYNHLCLNPYQAVVLKTVEVDEDGVLKTIINKDNDDAGDRYNTDVDEEYEDNSIIESASNDHPEEQAVPQKPKDLLESENAPSDDEFTIDLDEEGFAEVAVVTQSGTSFGDKQHYTVAPTPRILPRMIPAVNKKVYAMKGSALCPWVPGRVVNVHRNSFNNKLEFRVELDCGSGKKGQGSQIRTMTAKQLAFSLQTPFILPVGARVIARFKDEFKVSQPGCRDFYAGIVAERPTPHNRNRYLIFFDDGYAQYVSVDHVLWVCESSKDVWNDVHPNTQEFIKNYLKIYPERPMVRLAKGTTVSTEWNGNWWVGRVVEVDCSLVKMHFDADNRYEWIYRGSTRLAPLFNKIMRQSIANRIESTTPVRRRHDVHAASHSSEAKIEYLTNAKIVSSAQTARKSTAGPTRIKLEPLDTKVGINNRPLSKIGKKPFGVTTSTGLLEYEGKMMKVLIPEEINGPKNFVPHICKPSCVRFFKEDDPQTKMLNPLALPMFYGWDREVGKTPRRTIFYRAPCGRRFRDYEELHDFLVQTKYNMGMDHFCFDYAVDCFNEFVPFSHHFLISDITYGEEAVPVQCCNTIDHDYPEYVEYTKDRIAGKGVKINTEIEFLSCCDCTDDCSDKEKCACWKMTLQGMNMAGEEFNLEVGYQNRRLMDHCITGIYECNPRCRCKKTCLNRVVQHPMKWQLQIFKTSNKGWAIRPIHDIPQGSFICVYAGQLLTEHGANEDGKAFGDEYLAELDYIEVCESYKEGFESNVVEPEIQPRRRRRESRDSMDICEEGDEDYKADENITANNERNTTYSLRGGPRRHEGKSGKDNDNRSSKKSTRDFFGQDEFCYIMDAKSVGNIGRYLNHSCQPNVFVQNVFVDTHDLRFPWVAFFAYKHIRAGTELTWDYNYDIGSVPGKTMYCYCGTPECRGRLL